MASTLIPVYRRLSVGLDNLRRIHSLPLAYNPLAYAQQPWERYLRLATHVPQRVVMIGMNPGPWGMVQSGVPFGDLGLVSDWLGIQGAVGQPDQIHPRRPVQGFSCTRGEASGRRLWGWARDRFETPQRFFERFFVANYCPLAFFDSAGVNITPDKLPIAYRRGVETLCDDTLREVLDVLKPSLAVGIGAYVQSRLRIAAPPSVPVGRITHPSPANPVANRGWAAKIESELAALGVHVAPGEVVSCRPSTPTNGSAYGRRIPAIPCIRSRPRG